MAETPTLYLESTIPSYLAAKPSRDLIVASHQQITHEWWSSSRSRFDMYISEAVLDEAGRGDPDAASRRLEIVKNLPVLALTKEIESLALEYLDSLALPGRARLDVIHLACAVIYELDYLLTWNCAHLANGVVIRRLQDFNSPRGLAIPVIVTPEELLEEPIGD